MFPDRQDSTGFGHRYLPACSSLWRSILSMSYGRGKWRAPKNSYSRAAIWGTSGESFTMIWFVGFRCSVWQRSSEEVQVIQKHSHQTTYSLSLAVIIVIACS